MEAAIFCVEDSEDLIIQPRVLAKTEVMPRTILVRKTILAESDDDPIQEHEPSPIEDANERFWTAVLGDLAFDDSEAMAPQPSRNANVWVKVAGSGYGGWGITFGAYLNRGQSSIGTYLTWREGFRKARTVYNEIVGALGSDENKAIELGGWKQWANSAGQPRVGFSRNTEFLDGVEICDFDEAVDWMREHFNRLVNTLHPECRRRLRAQV